MAFRTEIVTPTSLVKRKLGIARWVGVLAVFVQAFATTGCNRTVTWEEEVPLNTGETIWVRRITTKTLKGAGDNPLDLGMRPDWKETIAFSYKGKDYEYTGEAHLLVLAVSPQGLPVLVAPAADGGWDAKHSYGCTTPHYVQLMPGSTGKTWTWPEKVETWLHGLPANLMLKRTELPAGKNRFTVQERNVLDASVRAGSEKYKRIDSQYLSEACKRKK